MSKNKKHILRIKEKQIIDFDEEDDIYMPDSIWQELKFIFFMLNYIRKNPEEQQKELKNLRRQLAIYLFWTKNRLSNLHFSLVSLFFTYRKIFRKLFF